MIIYNVTVNIADGVHHEWLQWMKEVHIPDVMNTGLFIEYKFCRILVEEESGTTYSVQYSCKSIDDYNKYKEEYAPKLQQEHSKKFADKFVAFRTLMEVV